MKNTLFRYSCFALALILNLSSIANEGLDTDLAILKINKEVKALNNEILSLKDEIEILRENQRLNSEKITELLQMIELNRSSNSNATQTSSINQNTRPAKLFSDGKNAFVLGNYEKSIELFLEYLNSSPSALSKTDTMLWLGRAYFYSESFLESKNAYLEYQSMGQNHPKLPDSLYELSRVLLELSEKDDAKILLNKMINDHPNHLLTSKASALLQSL